MTHALGLQSGPRRGNFLLIRGSSFIQAALIALALTLVGGESARAGTMYVYSCHTPQGAPVGTSGWTSTPGMARSHAFSDCDAGPRGALYAYAGNLMDPYFVSWWFSAAPNTSIVGFSASACFRSMTIPGGPAGIAGMSWPNQFPLRTAPEAPWTSSGDIGCQGGPPYFADARNTLQRVVSPSPRIYFTAACFLGCSAVGPQASIEIASFRADIRDASAPRVSAVRGALAANLSHTGIESVEFDAVDVGVGIYRAVAEARARGQDAWREVVTAPVGKHRVPCTALAVTTHPYEFNHPQPCPPSVTRARLDFNSDSLAPGEYEFRVLVEDASGNRSLVITPRRFIAKGPARTASPALATERALALTIDGAARRNLARAEAFRVRGKLTDTDARPVGSASLTVRTRAFLPKPGAPTGDWSVLGQVVTAADGTFSARIPAGASRTVQVVHVAGGGFAAAAAQVDVVVRAQVTATVRAARIRNGRSAVFSGRVRGPIPSGGVLAALEVREPGRWIPVATTRRWVRTSSTGRFRLSYRFRRTFQPSTYRFRVVAAEDSAFEYSRGVSRTIEVRVRP